MVLCDINSDEHFELVLCDYSDILQSLCLAGNQTSSKIKVYKDLSMVSEVSFLDLPVQIATVHIDTLVPNVPALAIASGACIYLFKNLRPYFKFNCPSLQINETEKQAWINFKTGNISMVNLVEILDGMRCEGKLSEMMQRSLQLLGMSGEEERKEFVDSIKDVPLARSASITCMTSMKKNSLDDDAINCLVLGLEHGQVSVINPETFSVLFSHLLDSAPVFLSAQGLYDVEYTILISCRNGAVYAIKRDAAKPKELFRLSSHIVGLLRVGKSIIVGSMDDMLRAYTMKGKKLWSAKLPGTILCMESADLKMRNIQIILVSIHPSNNSKYGEVHVYLDKTLVDVIATQDLVTSMKFGRYGREDDSLVMVTNMGMLMVKMLKRTAQFDEKRSESNETIPQKLEIPKKSKLFLNNIAREKEFSKEMFHQFQQDLCRLRLDVAKKYVEVLDKSLVAVSVDKEAQIQLNVEICGLGPRFKMNLLIQNTSLSSTCIGLYITFEWQDSFYSIDEPILELPMLVPGVSYVFSSFINCISDKAVSDTIKVLVCKGNGPPILTAIVDMPASEGTTN